MNLQLLTIRSTPLNCPFFIHFHQLFQTKQHRFSYSNTIKPSIVQANHQERQPLAPFMNLLLKPFSCSIIILLRDMDAKRQIDNRSPNSKLAKRPSYATELGVECNLGTANIYQSRKQLTYSTFLDIHDDPFTPTTPHPSSNLRQLSPRNLQLIRARSLKTIADHKPIVQTAAEKMTSDLTQNTLRLKIEEMTFKYKNKIGCLLKEIKVSNEELNKFHIINKTDEILNFLTLKVREKIVKSQINEANLTSATFKNKQTTNEYQVQREILKKRLQDKQNIEKELKNKLRESHLQVRDLLSKVAIKEKELSVKINELYQQKVTLGEQESLISRLQATCDSLQKMSKDSINQLTTDSKDIITVNKGLQEQNAQLATLLQEFKSEINQYKEKQNKLMQINQQLSDEVTRWRVRYEDGPAPEKEKSESQEAIVPLTPSHSNRSMKISTMSVNNYGFRQSEARNSRFSTTSQQIENMRLVTKIQELQKKNKQLTRDILNYATIKERYQQTLASIGQQSRQLSEGLDVKKIEHFKQSSVDLYKLELEEHYKKKIQEVAKDWKDKLYEIVHKYEDELQLAKEQTERVERQKQELKKKINVLANQKCIVETKLIEKERQIYEMMRMMGTSCIHQEKKAIRDSNTSHSNLSSELSIKTPSLIEVAQVLNENQEITLMNLQTQVQDQTYEGISHKNGQYI